MSFELTIAAIAALIALGGMIVTAVLGRLNALDDDNPPTITIHPPLPPDDGK